MPVPAFLSALIPIHAPPDAEVEFSAKVSAKFEASVDQLGLCLGLKMPGSELSEWCWAATAVSVANLLNPTDAWTQCRLASECLTMPCCPPTEDCNRQYALDRALIKTGNLAVAVEGALRFEEIVREIDNSHPVCCHIRWTGDAGHFNVIAGYVSATQDVIVRDSLFDKDQVLPYSQFKSKYKNDGVWDYSYLTTKKAP